MPQTSGLAPQATQPEDAENPDNTDGGSIRDQLESALADAGADMPERTSDAPDTSTASEETAKAVKDEKPPSATKDDAAPTSPEDAIPPDEKTDEKTSTDKAPMDWGPEEREHWAGLPPAVKNRIAARENQVNKMLSEGAEFRKAGQQLDALVRPHQSLLAAEGVSTPLEAVKNMLDTVSVLRMGSAESKAAAMASLISAYGIDIQTLDNAIVNAQQQQSEGQQQGPDISRMVQDQVNKALAPYQQQQRQAVDSQLQDFADKNEFFQDVMPIMRDLYDLAAKRGEKLDLQTAYDRACAYHPGVQETLKHRGAVGAQQQQQERKARKMAASASVAGETPAGDTSGVANDGSIRGNLQAALAEQLQGG